MSLRSPPPDPRPPLTTTLHAPGDPAGDGSRSEAPWITAYSVGNALGADAVEVARSLAAGVSGLRPCRLPLPFETMAGHFPDVLEPVPAALAAYDSRLVRMTFAVLDGVAGAVERAIRRWGRDRVAIVLGTSTGGILETEAALETHATTGALPRTWSLEKTHGFHALLEAVRLRTGARGPAFVVSTACSSSGKVLGSARRLVATGAADAVLTGGVDTLCQTTLRGFRSLEALCLGRLPSVQRGAERNQPRRGRRVPARRARGGRTGAGPRGGRDLGRLPHEPSAP